MSPREIQKIYQANHENILEKLKRLHHQSSDSVDIAEIVDLMKQNKALFDNISCDRDYCINTVKKFTGEFQAVGGADDDIT